MFGQVIDIMQTGVGKKFAKQKNNYEFMNWFNLLERYAQYRYEFEGLPDTVDERVLKQALIWYGSCVFFDKEDNLICLPGRGTADFTVYGLPIKAYVWGRNGYNECIDLHIQGQEESKFVTKGINTPPHTKGRGVLVRENYKFYPFANYIYNYAWKITDTMRTLDTERFHLKRPYIITAKEEVVPTVKKYMDKTADNEEYIVSSGIFDANDVNALPITLPTGAIKETEELVDWYINQYLTLCGLNNNQQIDKKERMLVDEVNSNNESIDNNIQPMVQYIQEQLDFVNTIYNTNIKIKAMKEEYGDDEQDILGSDKRQRGTDSVSGDTSSKRQRNKKSSV